jgi:hypothetical protein
MTTSEEKLRVIALLKFSVTLENLEHYLDLIDYLRFFVYHYADVARSLQDLKTYLFKNSSESDRRRRAFISRVKITLTSEETEFFENLQQLLFNFSMLIHFSFKRDF